MMNLAEYKKFLKTQEAYKLSMESATVREADGKYSNDINSVQ